MGLLTRVGNDDAASSLSHAQHVENKENKDLEQNIHETFASNQAKIMKVNDPKSHLKAKLKSLLAKYNGCTKNSEVVQVVNQLSEINPHPQKCTKTDMFEGEFYTLTAPPFPGRIKPTTKDEEDIAKYTLGRISFNIFQPDKLVCTLRSVRNLVDRRPQMSEGRNTWSYHLVLDITIHSPNGDLPATMINEAYCCEHSDVNNRLSVTFTGGTLMPADEVIHDTTKLKVWETTFRGAYQKADEERSYLGWFFHYLTKMLLGLTLPSDNRNQEQDILKNTFHYDIQRSPTGHVDVLYLDEDLRITKGNRGTVVVAERAVTLPQQRRNKQVH